MPQRAHAVEETATQQQDTSAPRPWKRQNGESALWFNRFCLYLDLGYKRTVQAAVEQERQKIKALKSTAPPASSRQKKVGKGEEATITEVPKPKAIQVPGSWKQASIAWRWVERARAWDQYAIDFSVKKNMEAFLDNALTLPMERIQALQGMLDTMRATYTASHQQMTLEQDCLYVGRMQSLLRDIREEMRLYDESLQRDVTYRQCTKLYTAMDSVALAEAKREQTQRKAK